MPVATTFSDLLNGGVFNATAYSDANVYLSLHTATPGTTGASEVTGGSYVRQAIPKVASSGGTYTSDAIIDFAGMPAVTVTHVGVWTASTAGTFRLGGALTVSKVVAAGDTFRIPAGSLTHVFA